jgi:hypothetical protein
MLQKVKVFLLFLVVQAMKFNILFEAVHIPGMLNTLADKLSRFQLKDIERQVPYLEKRATLFNNK